MSIVSIVSLVSLVSIVSIVGVYFCLEVLLDILSINELCDYEC